MRNPDGTVACSRCGRDVGGGSPNEAATIVFAGQDGRIETHHLCLAEGAGGRSCAGRVLTKAALAKAHERDESLPEHQRMPRLP